jgi:hypothetical protein
VWASLAQDYLSIMASSVSSEQAFSSAGITISKRRNRLKSDIVEALQFLKCAIRTDLLFREPDPSSRTEDVGEGEGEEGPDSYVEETLPWDSLLDDEEDLSDDACVQ